MNMLPLVVSWAVLASIVIGMAAYRSSIARKGDDYLHVNTDVISQQESVTQRLAGIDRWGKLLTIVVAIYALVLIGMFLYNGWMDSARLPR